MAAVDELFDCFEDNDDVDQQIVPVVTKDGKKNKTNQKNG